MQNMLKIMSEKLDGTSDYIQTAASIKGVKRYEIENKIHDKSKFDEEAMRYQLLNENKIYSVYSAVDSFCSAGFTSTTWTL